MEMKHFGVTEPQGKLGFISFGTYPQCIQTFTHTYLHTYACLLVYLLIHLRAIYLRMFLLLPYVHAYLHIYIRLYVHSSQMDAYDVRTYVHTYSCVRTCKHTLLPYWCVVYSSVGQPSSRTMWTTGSCLVWLQRCKISAITCSITSSARSPTSTPECALASKDCSKSSIAPKQKAKRVLLRRRWLEKRSCESDLFS